MAVDVYLTAKNGVCIRHGNEPEEYAGITHISDLTVFIEDSEDYKHALQMILRKKFPRK